MAIATTPANDFTLSCGGTRITYSTTSFGGVPLLQYVGPEGTLNFSDNEIETLPSALGTEVTVTLENSPDLRRITLTLLLPSFRLDADRKSEFETLAIKTTNHTTIAGPPIGPEQTYEAVALHGVAKAVEF